MTIKVMMIDNDINHLNAVDEYFRSSSSITVTKLFSSSQEALDFLDSEYDILIINMLLSDIDSATILSKFRKSKNDKKIIATSEYITPDMMSNLSIYTPNYFLKKPYNMEVLEKTILSLGMNSKTKLKVNITDTLHSLGIPSNIKGFDYIRDGVELMYNDHKKMNSITKVLYPTIANKYETTPSRVERAIRHAIEISWMRGDIDLMDELFGNSVDIDRSKPTNSEFISTLADRLKLQNNIV